MDYSNVVDFIKKMSEKENISDNLRCLYIVFALYNSVVTLGVITQIGYKLQNLYKNIDKENNGILPSWKKTIWSYFLNSYSFGYIANIREGVFLESKKFVFEKSFLFSAKKTKTIGYYLESENVNLETKQILREVMLHIEKAMDDLMSLVDSSQSISKNNEDLDFKVLEQNIIKLILEEEIKVVRSL